jgi:hypothetical protein
MFSCLYISLCVILCVSLVSLTFFLCEVLISCIASSVLKVIHENVTRVKNKDLSCMYLVNE